MKPSTIFSVCLLISFFLPWVDFGFFYLSGYNIPLSLDKVSNINESPGIYKISYFLYLIPVCSVFNIIKDISGAKGFYLLDEFGVGILSVIVLYIFAENGTSVLSIGYYLTAILSVLGFISNWSENAKRDHNANTDEQSNEQPKISISKADLLSQLSQLQTLQEKGVLTNDIYEQEKQEILSELQKKTILETPIKSKISEQPIVPPAKVSSSKEQHFENKTWFKRNKGSFISVTITILLFALIICFTR